MSWAVRSSPFRRLIPSIVEERIDEALKYEMYIVQELGPLGFIIRVGEKQSAVGDEFHDNDGNHNNINDHNDDEDSNGNSNHNHHHGHDHIHHGHQMNGSKKSNTFKIGLGGMQRCSCPTFLSQRELCIHILWVMLKVFRIDRHSEMIFQKSLVEREVDELLSSRRSYLVKLMVLLIFIFTY